MDFRIATAEDASLLAKMNRDLIRDEGHRNPMSLAELTERMEGWLACGEYQAALFVVEGSPVGYCLFRGEPDHIYVRQYYVVAASRRQGIATSAWKWLIQNPWKERARIRLDVLLGNAGGIAFWKSLGFSDYCVTMELNRPDGC